MAEMSRWKPSRLPRLRRFVPRLGAQAIRGLSAVADTLLAAAVAAGRPNLTPMTHGSSPRGRRRGLAPVLAARKQQAGVIGERVPELRRTRTSLLAATLLFSTSFGPDITLSVPQGFDSGATNGWQYFSGPNIGVSGRTLQTAWPTLWGNSIALQVLVDATATSSTVGNYIQNQIQTVAGPSGSQTQALYQEVVQQAGGSTQDPLLLRPRIDPGDVYISEWIKFQPDLAQKMGPNAWRAFFEFKTAGDFRIASYIHTDSRGSPYWLTHGDNVANGGLSYQEFWSQSSHSVAVPQGQWFHLELFWHRSGHFDVNGGRFWEAVNGQTLVDESNATYPTHNTSMMGVNNAPVNRIMIAQVYSGGRFDQKPAFQWVTDLQIWDSIPPLAPTVPPGSAPFASPTSAPLLARPASRRSSICTPPCRNGLWRYPNGGPASGPRLLAAERRLADGGTVAAGEECRGGGSGVRSAEALGAGNSRPPRAGPTAFRGGVGTGRSTADPRSPSPADQSQAGSCQAPG